MAKATKVGLRFEVGRRLALNPQLQSDFLPIMAVIRELQVFSRYREYGFGIGFDPEAYAGSKIAAAKWGLDILLQEITHADPLLTVSV
jgi:hypothetical protein